MREPAFWQRGGIAAQLLAPAAAIYAAIADSRMKRAGARADVPVLCIGNLTAGGAGKTPEPLRWAPSLFGEGGRAKEII